MADVRSVVLALSLGLGALSCVAQGCGPYRVAMREYPRLYQRDADGRFGGVDKEFFDLLAERSGCRFEFQLESQPRTWQKLARGELDMAAWVIPSEERAAIVKVVPVISSRPMAMTWRNAGVKGEAQFLANPALHAIAIRQSLYGSDYDALLQQLRSQGRVSEVADFDTAFRAFAARRVDLMVLYPWALAGQPSEWLAQVQLTDWHATAPGVACGLALSHKTVREADAQRLEQALRTMRQDGSLAQLLERHMPAGAYKLLP